MTLQEIKAAVEIGQTVYADTDPYVVIKDRIGQWLIHCTLNDSYIGLTWANGKNFYTK
jgi:hypothetical protein